MSARTSATSSPPSTYSRSVQLEFSPGRVDSNWGGPPSRADSHVAWSSFRGADRVDSQVRRIPISRDRRHRNGGTLTAHFSLGYLTQGSATTQRATASHLQHYTSKALRSFYEMTRSNGAVPRHATVAFRPDFLKLTIGRLTDVCGATVENLHSPSKSTKGAESLGPFGFTTLRGCGGWI